MTDTKSPPYAVEGPQTGLDLGLFRDVFFAFHQGFCVFELLLDETGTPSDYRFLEVDHCFERMTGLNAPVGKTALQLVPNLERHWIEVYGRVALTGESTHFVQGSEAMGRWFDVHAARIGKPEQHLVALVFNDITAHRRVQEERGRAEAALRASEHRFRVFADTAPAMLWVTPSSWNIACAGPMGHTDGSSTPGDRASDPTAPSTGTSARSSTFTIARSRRSGWISP